MNDHDLLTRRVNDALIGADPKDAARAEAALADYTPGDPVGALILLTTFRRPSARTPPTRRSG